MSELALIDAQNFHMEIDLASRITRDAIKDPIWKRGAQING